MRKYLVALVLMSACAPPAEEDPMPADIIANNVFFYYDNLEEATRFYSETWKYEGNEALLTALAE